MEKGLFVWEFKKKHQYSQKTAITVKLLYRALVVFIRHVTLPLHCQLFFSAMTSLFKSLFFSKHCLLTLISQVLPFSLVRIQFRSISHCLSRCLWITSTDQESRALSSHQPFSSLPEGMKSARAHSQMLRYEDWELEGGGGQTWSFPHTPHF